ncbi:MAG: hypothetical protein HOV70_19880 [Streptomyces sp.]|nr:hypothetical protein [Streptomyces sp.]
MTVSPLALAAKKVIDAAWLHGDAYDLSSQAAFALESAQLLQSPETAAELGRLRARVAELETERHVTNEALSEAAEALRSDRDRIAKLEQQVGAKDHPADEGPIAYALTDKAEATASEYRYCGADLGRAEYPFTCERRIAHKGPCAPTRDDADDVRPQVRKLRALLAGQRAQTGGA